MSNQWKINAKDKLGGETSFDMSGPEFANEAAVKEHFERVNGRRFEFISAEAVGLPRSALFAAPVEAPSAPPPVPPVAVVTPPTPVAPPAPSPRKRPESPTVEKEEKNG